MPNNTDSAQRVYIVILNWNGWKDTIECLESVMRLSHNDYQIIVCDNDSEDGSVEKIVDWAQGDFESHAASENMSIYSKPAVQKPIPYALLSIEDVLNDISIDPSLPLVLIRTGGNLGFAGGNNVGIRFAMQQNQCDYVWLLNNDTVVKADTLSQMLLHSMALNAKGVPNTCGSVQRYYYSPEKIQALGGFKFNPWTGICSATLGMERDANETIDHDAFRSQLDAIHGCSWLLPRAFLSDIGLMEERYFLYYEEIDWTLRAKGKYQLTYADMAIVFHKEGGSIGSRSINKKASLFSDFHGFKSRIMMMKKCFPFRLPVVLLFILLTAAKRLKEGDFARAKLLLAVVFGKKTFP